jgi:methionine-S-sulfoxide reductase
MQEPEVAVLAGGCFWGMEDLLRRLPGVLDTEVGYAGGATAQPTYPQVRTGTTGHAEALKVVFDPQRLSLEALLDHFFRIHDPTTANRQGNDVGSQYRSAIFAQSEEQRSRAQAVVEQVQASGRWERPLTTQVVLDPNFWPAEDYHQDYLVNNPGGYSCHYYRD